MDMKAGDLVKFSYVNNHCRDINKKVGIFLGERPLKRDDGVVIENFAVLLFGEDKPRLCDKSLKRWLKVVEE
tara:strand:+ start:2039 stop:2254 length:216 start_codon:yes stop_codon:yes gene_type:complete